MPCITFIILLWTSSCSSCLSWGGRSTTAHGRGHTTDLYRGRAKMSDLFPKIRQVLWPLLSPEVVSCVTAHDFVLPWQWQAHCFLCEARLLFPIWIAVFIHSDTNNVSMLHTQSQMLLAALQLLPTLSSAQSSCTALLYLGHRACAGAATWRVGFHLGMELEARRPYAWSWGYNSGGNRQVQAEPQAQRCSYLTLYTHLCFP